MTTNTTATILKLIADELRMDSSSVSLTASLTNDLNVDSLSRVEILLAIEDLYGVELTDEDAVSIDTIQALVDAIDKLIAAK